MRATSERSLKSLNFKWLVLLGIADILAVLLFVAPDIFTSASLTHIGVGRLLAITVMPVIVMLSVNVLPHDVKSMLVYWKPRGVLPGCEAFTKHGPSDLRIDMSALKKNIGVLPIEAGEQNSKWYKLYKLVPNEPEVAEAHRLFLMYRDMAVMTLPLIFLAPFLLRFAGVSHDTSWVAVSLFAIQYLLTAVSARWSGIRFVCNVLAAHSVRKITNVKPQTASRPSV